MLAILCPWKMAASRKWRGTFPDSQVREELAHKGGPKDVPVAYQTSRKHHATIEQRWSANLFYLPRLLLPWFGWTVTFSIIRTFTINLTKQDRFLNECRIFSASGMPATMEHFSIKEPKSWSSQRCSSKISLQQRDAYSCLRDSGDDPSNNPSDASRGQRFL